MSIIFSRIALFKINFCYYSTNVRVRFAPSPTGHLHLGGLRTALYNFLFAKSNDGQFILRIEDTDRTRFVEGATEAIIKDLRWAGIVIDEGPDIGGNYGPYLQSQRLNIYQDHVKLLLNNKTAYKCFCTESRLNMLRREAQKNREIPKYDNKCRNLTEEQITQRINKGEVPCMRFKINPGIVTFDDLVYGSISNDVSKNEGDPVIMKMDGYPTYHFANVVDDHLMNITHVLRGVEWQVSTPKHLLMYQAFNWNPPQFAHLPLLVNSDGTKLSKRQGDIKIESYKESGIFPLALINFITQSGGGFTKDLEKNVKPMIHTISELASQFDIENVNSHSGKLMNERLGEFNRLELKRKLNIDVEFEKLKGKLQRLLEETHKETLQNLQLDEEYVESVLKWASDRIEKVEDLLDKNLSFIWSIPKNYDVDKELLFVIDKLTESLEEETDFSRDHMNKKLKKFAGDHNIKYSNFMKLLRSVLSGLKEGPAVAEMMEILGKENTLHRLRLCLKK